MNLSSSDVEPALCLVRVNTVEQIVKVMTITESTPCCKNQFHKQNLKPSFYPFPPTLKLVLFCFKFAPEFMYCT